MVGQLIGREIASTKEIEFVEWAVIRERAYPNWRNAPDGEWPDIDSVYSNSLAALSKSYEEIVNGQLNMFPAEESPPVKHHSEYEGGAPLPKSTRNNPRMLRTGD